MNDDEIVQQRVSGRSARAIARVQGCTLTEVNRVLDRFTETTIDDKTRTYFDASSCVDRRNRPGVRITGAKNFRLALEHPLRIPFANFSLLRGGGSEKQIFDGAQVTRSGSGLRTETSPIDFDELIVRSIQPRFFQEGRNGLSASDGGRSCRAVARNLLQISIG